VTRLTASLLAKTIGSYGKEELARPQSWSQRAAGEALAFSSLHFQPGRDTRVPRLHRFVVVNKECWTGPGHSRRIGLCKLWKDVVA
jgi:hypothetical protein